MEDGGSRIGNEWAKRRARDSGNHFLMRTRIGVFGYCNIVSADFTSALFPLYPPSSLKSWHTSDTRLVPLSDASGVLYLPKIIKVPFIFLPP